MTAVREDRDSAEFITEETGEEPVILRLIALYLQMNKPNLALAWCIFASVEGPAPRPTTT